VLVQICILRIRFHALGWSYPISKEAILSITRFNASISSHG
jgi:hypothetical protein